MKGWKEEEQEEERVFDKKKKKSFKKSKDGYFLKSSKYLNGNPILLFTDSLSIFIKNYE